MSRLASPGLVVGLIILIALASPAAAFGAGNIASISKIEGLNWRHGDIEDALLTLTMAHAFKGKKFTKMMVSRVYFGNWLRDYSQAIDVGTVKSVSAEAIRLLLCILGFLTFGYGSGEFEVTAERLGCYRPEDHIDNPKNYADNKDARQYDRRLRGPVDEGTELAIDPETGMKNYIANERAGIMTSALHVRRLFGGCIELGRRYKQTGNKAEFYESLRLMGTGLHCLEDFFAHSNYTELALIEMGEGDVFPHCGRDTLIRLQGARQEVYPIVTGTFGGVDFLHSVVGEVSDKLTQNEIDELEGTLQESKNADTRMLRDLLDKIPDGLFGGKKQSNRIDEIQSDANNAQLGGMAVSPRNPEEFTAYVGQVYQQIMPAIQFHDDIMKSITNAVEKIPVLPKLIEQLEEQLSKFVFSVIAPMVVPLIHQIRNELRTGSGEIVHISEQEQHIVFEDDNSSDPTHSMLSKDHFTNILNEIAGRTAAKMLHWVVPQIMQAIDDEGTDVNRLLDRIVNGVLHHPAQREMGQDGVAESRQSIFESVREWWGEMDDSQRDDYRRKLSREGVEQGQNHKEGVNDTGHGHGCAGKLKMRKLYGEPETLETKIAGAAANAIFQGATGALSSVVEQNTGYKLPSTQGSQPEEKAEEGGLSGLLGSVLGSVFGKGEKEKQTSYSQGADGSYTQTQTEYGRHGGRYEQAEYSHTQHPDGGSTSQYSRFEQQESHSGRQTAGYGYEERTETVPSYGGGYEQRTERREYGGSGQGEYGGGGSGGGYGGSHSGGYGASSGRQQQSSYGGGYGDSGRPQESSYGGSSGGGYGGSYARRDDEDSYGRESRRQEGGYGGGGGGYGGHSGRQDDEDNNYGRENRRQEGGYGGGHGGNSGRRDEEESYGRRQEGGYGGSHGGGGYGGNSGRRDEDDYSNQSRRQQSGHGGYSSRQESSGYEGGYERSSNRRDDDGYGNSGNRGEGGYDGGGGGRHGGGREESYGGGGNSGRYGGGREDSYGRGDGGREESSESSSSSSSSSNNNNNNYGRGGGGGGGGGGRNDYDDDDDGDDYERGGRRRGY